MRPKWHRAQAWVSSRGDQDGTIKETRGLGAGTKNDTQRKSKIAKMAPNSHGVRSLGCRREDQDGDSKKMLDFQDETKVA